MAEWALVIFYTCFFCLLIQRLPFFKNRALPRRVIQALFIWKAAIGLVYNYIMLHYYSGGDSYYYFQKGMFIDNILFKKPWDYFYLVFGFHHFPETGIQRWIYEDWMSIYNDSGAMLLVRFHALIGPFTMGFYNVHTVIYNFIVTGALVCLADFFYKHILTHRTALIIILFAIPSFDFWTSGMHKDGFTLAALGFIFYAFDKWLKEKKIKYVVVLVVFCWFLFWLRLYVFIILLPWLVVSALHEKIPGVKKSVYPVVYLIFSGILLFQILWRSDAWQNYIFRQQAELKKYEIRTPGIVPSAETLPAKIVFAIPSALLYPMHWTKTNTLAKISVLENDGILLLLIFIIIISIRNKCSVSHFNAGIILFALSYLFVIGYFIHIEGALPRYKSIPVFLLLAALSGIGLEKKKSVPR